MTQISNIDTERLYLEPIQIADAPFILELVNTEGWLRFIGDRNVHSEQEAERYIEKIRATANLTYWVVRRKEDQLPLGIISFLKREYLEHFDLGFAFLPKFQGKGYAEEAAAEVLRGLKQDTELETILATTMPLNEGSVRLLKKLGFEFVKELKAGEQFLHLYSYPLISEKNLGYDKEPRIC